MVGMFMGNENGRKRLRILSERLHALECLTAGDAGVDQYPGASAGHERTISPAPAGQHRDSHTHIRSIRAPPVEPGVTFRLADTFEGPLPAFGIPLLVGNQN